MSIKIIATYANGVFTPDEPLNLPENSLWKIEVEILGDHSIKADQAIRKSDLDRRNQTNIPTTGDG